MTNPYEILKVAKKATEKEIKVSYRKLVKTLHPDVGGKQADFDQLQKAYDVLMDPDLRKRLDTTGRWDASVVTPARIRSFIEQTMRTVVEAARGDGSSDDPVFDNIKDRIIHSLLQARREIKNNQYRTQRKIERATRLLERFKTAEDFDPVGVSLRSELARLKDELKTHDDAIELSEAVEKTLKTYKYGVGPEPQGQDGPEPTIRLSGLRMPY